MEQHEAVKKMMFSIKLQEDIPDKYHSYLRQLFQQMYAAGWEEGRNSAYLNRQKLIGQFNREGKLINTFKGKKEACKKTGFAYTRLRSALERGSTTRQGWTWRYIEPYPLGHKKEGALTDTL